MAAIEARGGDGADAPQLTTEALGDRVGELMPQLTEELAELGLVLESETVSPSN